MLILNKKLFFSSINSCRTSCYSVVQELLQMETMQQSSKTEWSSSGECIIEKDVGITMFTSSTEGFLSIHKQRFSDFVVREVSLTGKVATLDSIDDLLADSAFVENEEIKSLVSAATTTTEKLEEVQSDITKALLSNNIEELSSVITLNPELKVFLISAIEKKDDCSLSYQAFPCSNKAMRTQLHAIFRTHLSAAIETDTMAIDVDGTPVQYFRLHAKHKNTNSNNKRDGAINSSGSTIANNALVKRSNWPKNVGDYLKFTLLKENVDTISACNMISRNLYLRNNRISYAGTKDKRGITVQSCTVFRKRASDFRRINQSNLSPFIRVGNFEFVNEGMSLGQLSGNQFTIVLRGITCDIGIVDKACEALQKNGFINYFGLQV